MLLAEFPCLESWNAVIISLCVVVAEVPRFGLQLSCFGHDRAKTNSEFPCRLELCLTFRLGIISGCLSSFTRAMEGLLLRVCSGWPLGCVGLADLWTA